MHSNQMLSSAPKHKKAVICFIEGIYVLDQPHSGKSYIALLVVSSMLMIQQYDTFGKKKRICHSVLEDGPESAVITPLMHDKTMEIGKDGQCIG